MLERLRLRLAEEGLHIVLPLTASAFNEVSAAEGGPSLEALLLGASGAFVIGDGGPEFFTRFRAAQRQDGGARVPVPENPLDEYTRQRVARAVGETLVGRGTTVPHRVIHPFDRDGGGGPKARPLPFQRLGQAAGVPEPGPLGIQVHPVFGPWWAYRALIVVGAQAGVVAAEGALASSCPGCPAPCAQACPGHAVARANPLSFERCAAERLTAPACATSCAARLACPVGLDHRYPREQLAFHMTAALVQLRAYVHQHLPRPAGGAGA